MPVKASNYSPGKWREFVAKSDSELIAKCQVESFVGPGKGGQKRNKTSNAVRLRFDHFTIVSTDTRSRATNQIIALKKLRFEISLDDSQISNRQLDVKWLVSDLKPYIQNGLIRINPKNSDLPLVFGHLIDLFIEHEGNNAEIAERLGVSSTQLNRFIQKYSNLAEKVKSVKGKTGKSERWL